MWNVFRKKRGTIRLRVIPFSEEAKIVNLVRAYYCWSEKEAVSFIFREGLMSAKERLRNAARKEAVETEEAPTPTERKPTEPAPKKKPFSNKAISAGHLRLASYYSGNEKRNMVKFCNEDSSRLIKAGYDTFTCEFQRDRYVLRLFKNGKGENKFQKLRNGKQTYLAILGDPTERIGKELRLDPDKFADFPFSMREGRGCLIIEI